MNEAENPRIVWTRNCISRNHDVLEAMYVIPRLGIHITDHLLSCYLGQASSARRGRPVTCLFMVMWVLAGERHAQRGDHGHPLFGTFH